jgi:hydrogenase maturation protease
VCAEGRGAGPAPSLVVIGAGNLLMTDDGVGVRAIHALQASGIEKEVPGLVLVDAGTAALDYLLGNAVSGRLVLVDAVGCGGVPGTIYRFDRESIREKKDGVGLSAHDISLLESLALAELAGSRFESVTIVGVEPFEVRPGIELTEGMLARLPEVVSAVRREILAKSGA